MRKAWSAVPVLGAVCDHISKRVSVYLTLTAAPESQQGRRVIVSLPVADARRLASSIALMCDALDANSQKEAARG